jgi:hypothetical protein
MAGFAAKLVIGCVVAGVMFAVRVEAGQQAPAPRASLPSLPQNSPQPRLMPPIRFAPLQRLPPPFYAPQPPGTNTRPPLPEIWVEPFVVCGMTIIPAPVNVDPRFARPAQPTQPGLSQRFRRVLPPMCSIADARPRRPDAPR